MEEFESGSTTGRFFGFAAFAASRAGPAGGSDTAWKRYGGSRLLLTLLQHRETIWNVYLSTSRDVAPTGRMNLEFEPAGENEAGVRYTRPVAGELWRALQDGESLRRSQLAEELEQAFGPDREGDGADGDDAG